MFAIFVIGIAFLALVLFMRPHVARRLKGQGTQPVGKALGALLTKEFTIEPKLLATWRCRIRKGRFGGAVVQYVVVFDPARMAAATSKGGGYAAMVKDGPAVQFEARQFSSERFYIEDRRAGQVAFADEGA